MFDMNDVSFILAIFLAWLLGHVQGIRIGKESDGNEAQKHPLSLELPYAMFGLGLSESLSQARRAILQGGVFVNGERVTDPRHNVTASDLVDGIALIRVGKTRQEELAANRLNELVTRQSGA